MIAAEVMTVAPDFGHLEPMLDAAQRPDFGRRRHRRRFPRLCCDGTPGYWHEQQMERIVDRGIPVLIPPDAKSRKGTRPGWDDDLHAFMRRVFASERGGELYAQRQAIIEPVFANTKFNRGIDPFRRRGRAAVRAEWRLITATHNLLKLRESVVSGGGSATTGRSSVRRRADS